MRDFFDKHGYPASVVHAGLYGAQPKGAHFLVE